MQRSSNYLFNWQNLVDHFQQAIKFFNIQAFIWRSEEWELGFKGLAKKMVCVCVCGFFFFFHQLVLGHPYVEIKFKYWLYTPFTMFNSKWITDLKIKCKTIKVLKDSCSENFVFCFFEKHRNIRTCFSFSPRCRLWGSFRLSTAAEQYDLPHALAGLWFLPVADSFCNCVMLGIMGTLWRYINVGGLLAAVC
jgi:hypothetical protein